MHKSAFITLAFLTAFNLTSCTGMPQSTLYHKVKNIHLDSNQKFTVNYYPDGTIKSIYETGQRPNNTTYLKKLETFDSNGNIIELHQWNPDGKIAEDIYDSKGNKMKGCSWIPTEAQKYTAKKKWKGPKGTGVCNLYNPEGDLMQKNINTNKKEIIKLYQKKK